MLLLKTHHNALNLLYIFRLLKIIVLPKITLIHENLKWSNPRFNGTKLESKNFMPIISILTDDMDKISKEQRSWNMAQIKSRDTKPEKLVRSLLHRMGYRFRIHRTDLPGKPDIVLSKYRTIIFVHGCFWHRHSDCKYATFPKTNIDYWTRKFENNVYRDTQNIVNLQNQGWNVFTIWECELNDISLLESRIINYFNEFSTNIKMTPLNYELNNN